MALTSLLHRPTLAPRGQRTVGSLPCNHRANTALIAGRSLGGYASADGLLGSRGHACL